MNRDVVRCGAGLCVVLWRALVQTLRPRLRGIAAVLAITLDGVCAYQVAAVIVWSLVFAALIYAYLYYAFMPTPYHFAPVIFDFRLFDTHTHTHTHTRTHTLTDMNSCSAHA